MINIAPNNGQTWSQKNKTCLNTINNTPDGKFYNTFSYAAVYLTASEQRASAPCNG